MGSLSDYTNRQLLSEVGHKKRVHSAFHGLTKTWKVLKEFREYPTETMLAEDLRPHLAGLKHPNIVEQDPPFEAEEKVWIVEELLDGTFEDLAPMSHQYGYAVLASQIADAIEFLHSNDGRRTKPVVHGDIHLRNCGILDGTAKLIDFGQATYEDTDSPRTIGGGYICTRAPEQFAETAYARTGLDIWAFGCTLYALRVGEYPFLSADELEEHRTAGEPRRGEIEALVAARTAHGINDEFVLRHRELFDDQLWSILHAALQEQGSRCNAISLRDQISAYVSTAEHSTASVDPALSAEQLARQRETDIAKGKVEPLAWFVDDLSTA